MEAMFYEVGDDGKVICHLCPHNCTISPGNRGRCLARRNVDGVLKAENYGVVTSMATDPMEKKPLYHFMPGRNILSIGTYGCNLSCIFCQNHAISRNIVERNHLSPEGLARTAVRQGVPAVAYTYNEPLIWFEYVLETAERVKEAGMANVLVTNGYINEEPLFELLPYIDAVNLDIKSCNEEFYRKLCGASLEPVLRTARILSETVHLEVTNLVIPGWNDSPEAIEKLAEWISTELGAHIPVHVSAYFPRYKMNAPPTPPETIKRAVDILSKHLHYVYPGNVPLPADTRCRNCGNTLVRRLGYSIEIVGLAPRGLCSNCSTDNHFRL